MPETLEVLVDGGKATAGPPLGPALGPMGLNIMEVVKADADKTRLGTLTITQAVKIANMKVDVMEAKDLRTRVLEVVGTCVSMGVTVDGKSPKEVTAEIRAGKYDRALQKT